MTEPILNSDPVMSALVTEAKRIHEDALFCSVGHTREARSWNCRQFCLGIPSTVIAAFVGVASLAGSENWLDTLLGESRFPLTGILALASAALVGLMTFLDPKGQAAKHYHAMALYNALRYKVRLFHEVRCQACGDVPALTAELQKLSDHLGKLHHQTPVISARAGKGAEKAIRAGKYAYAVDQQPHEPPDNQQSGLRTAKGTFGST